MSSLPTSSKLCGMILVEVGIDSKWLTCLNWHYGKHEVLIQQVIASSNGAEHLQDIPG